MKTMDFWLGYCLGILTFSAFVIIFILVWKGTNSEKIAKKEYKDWTHDPETTKLVIHHEYGCKRGWNPKTGDTYTWTNDYFWMFNGFSAQNPITHKTDTSLVYTVQMGGNTWKPEGMTGKEFEAATFVDTIHFKGVNNFDITTVNN